MSERRKVPEFSEHHLVDDEGNVWTPFRGGKLTSVYTTMRMAMSRSGYLYVCAGRGKPKWTVHQIVAAAFLGPCPEGHEVNHRNGNKLDNRPANLEYVSRQENMAHAWRSGLMPLGEKRGHAKLTPWMVRDARVRYARGETQRALAKEYGVAQATLSKAILGQKWSHIQ